MQKSHLELHDKCLLSGQSGIRGQLLGPTSPLTEILLVLLRQFQSFVGTLLDFVLTTSVQSS